jgi:hypothetical protein
LDKANLIRADLREANMQGATMPDGQQYEDWLKSKDREENG